MNTVISQALATGLPVIATRHSGLPDQVLDGVNGFLVDEGDYQALADRIIYAMDHPEVLAEFGAAGRRHVLENYDANVLIGRQIEYYEQLARHEDGR